MCQIQIIQKLGKEKIDKADMGEFFKMMCFGSMDNNDAFGVFNNDYIFKKKGSFDASTLDEYSLTNSNFIVGHNRFSTSWNKMDCYSPLIFTNRNTKDYMKWDWSLSFPSNLSNIFLPTYGFGKINFSNNGKYKPKKDISDKKNKDINSNINHHPFELGDFILMHNGVISNAKNLQYEYNFKTPISTDSYIILELIGHFFNKSKIKNRIKRIAYAVHKTCLEIKGSYSVLLYDKKSKKIFYFKNIFTSFHLYLYGDKILCGSTSSENLDYIYFGMKKKKYNLRNKRIYMITSDSGLPVVDVTPYKPSSDISWSNLLNYTNYDDMEYRIEKFLKNNLGFIPYYKITWCGNLKISRNNVNGIRKKIHKIVKNPKTRFGWYIIKSSDINPMVYKKKKIKLDKKKKIKLDKMKGGKK